MEPTGLRRLTVVLAADIVGYSRLMHADEGGTHARVQRLLREVVGPTVAEHRGQIVKTRGDGFLASFDSPVEAVRCGIVVQQAMVRRNLELPRPQWIQYRIGVNLGDIIIDQDDIYGEGVNIAARLEQIAEPGSIYISGAIYEQIKHKLVCSYQSLGDRKVKNITDPVTIYRVLPDPATVERAAWRSKGALALFALLMAGAGGAAWYSVQRLQYGPAPERLMPQSVRPEIPVRAAPSAPASPAPPPPTQAHPEPAQDEPLRETPKETNVAIVAPPPAPAQAPAAQVPPSHAGPARPAPLLPEMVRLPGGQFRMGSHDDPSEQPVHLVRLPPFWMGKYPVTVAEWRDCVAAGGCREIHDSAPDPAQPVTNASWQDAADYARWLARLTGQPYRLPSEAEWEYAARAGSTTRYWWGNEVGAGHALCRGCGSGPEAAGPLKAGSFAPNRFGLFDMAGGVAEWVADCWHPNYAGAPANGAAWECPGGGDHVLRGGSWMSPPEMLRVSDREHYETNVRYPGNGFRVARSE